MSTILYERNTNLAPNPDPPPAQERLQKIQQYLLRRRQRELLEKARKRRAMDISEPGKKSCSYAV